MSSFEGGGRAGGFKYYGIAHLMISYMWQVLALLQFLVRVNSPIATGNIPFFHSYLTTELQTLQDWLTEWLTPHIKTLNSGSLALKSFAFWGTAFSLSFFCLCDLAVAIFVSFYSLSPCMSKVRQYNSNFVLKWKKQLVNPSHSRDAVKSVFSTSKMAIITQTDKAR